MTTGYFYNKETLEVINEITLEKELPDEFLFEAMKHNIYPKVSYITLLGKIACADSSYVDRKILNSILDGNGLYERAIEFLCERYIFIKRKGINCGVGE